MPLSFENFKGEGLFGLSSSSDSQKICFLQDKSEIRQEKAELCDVVGGFLPEPTSVLDAIRSPSPLTVSSSHVTTVNAGDDKFSQMGLDDLHSLVLSGQEQRLIMDQGSGFSDFDPSFGFGPVPVSENSNPFCNFGNPEAMCLSPPAKRFNSGSYQPDLLLSDPDHDPVLQFHHQQLQIPSSGMAGDDESVIIEQLFNAAELIETTGDHTVLAQGILARLNHYLNSNNNNLKSPFLRAVSHISQVLLSLINNYDSSPPEKNLILKIAAYKSFSETSPFLQFVNFTSNQSILDSYNESGFDRIHIIDFDVGFGGQWPSLMQELVNGRRRNRASSLKLTVFTPPPSTISDEFELRFTEENLRTFAGELKLPFEIEFLNIELLLSSAYYPLSRRGKEAIAVNLPINSVIFSGYLPLILRFLKHISPNVVVCSDTGLDRNDTPFSNFVILALQYQTTLLESLDSNQNDSISIERFWVEPLIEKVLMKRHRWIERTLPWRSLFSQCGFSPVSLSQTAEAQAECLLQRWLVRGFRVEKRQASSLVLCWLRNELVTVSAWKC